MSLDIAQCEEVVVHVGRDEGGYAIAYIEPHTATYTTLDHNNAHCDHLWADEVVVRNNDTMTYIIPEVV